jgi:hypothetical protein
MFAPAPSVPRVIVDNRAGDVLIWSSGSPTRRIGGSWLSGPDARKSMPTADELKDFWTIASPDEASALVAEAAKALAVEPSSIR